MNAADGGSTLRQEIDAMIDKRDRLRISNTEWANLTKEVDPEGRGISRQTLVMLIHRRDRIPLTSTHRLMKLALLMAEEREKAAVRRIKEAAGTAEVEPTLAKVADGY